MSLINQVLEDLDKRRLEENSVTGVDDLRYAAVPKSSSGSKKILLLSLAVVLLIGCAVVTYYFVFMPQPDSPSAASNATKAIAPVKTQNTASHSTVSDKSVSQTPAIVAMTEKPVIQQEKKSSGKKAKITTSEPVAVVTETDEAESEPAAVATPFKKQVVPLRSEQRAELHYQTGYDQLKARRYQQAEQSLRQALNAETNHIKARELLSGLYIQQGRWVEASELLRHGVDLNPTYTTFTKLYARSLMQLNQDAAAVTLLEKSPPRIEADADYFAMLAALYQRQKNHAAAAETYAVILKQQSTNGVWWIGLGISLEALGRQQEAGQAYFHAQKTGNLQAEVSRFADQRLQALQEMGYPLQP